MSETTRVVAFALFDIVVTVAVACLTFVGLVYMFIALDAENWLGAATSVAVVFLGQGYLHWRVRHPLGEAP